MLALSRQKLPAVRLEAAPDNLCARGGYVLRPASGTPRAVLLASGSEVALALEAQTALEADGVATRVVSMVCWELFDAQGPDYRKQVLPSGTARVAIEARLAVRLGALYRRGGRRDRHVRLRRLGAGGRPLSPFRHHRRSRRRRREIPALATPEPSLTKN